MSDNPIREHELMMTRRQLFGRSALGLGTAAMAQLLGSDLRRRADQEGRRLPGELPETLQGRRPARLAREAAEVFSDIGAARQQAYACIEELQCWAAEGRPERSSNALVFFRSLLIPVFFACS